jgi:hypothetical protein
MDGMTFPLLAAMAAGRLWMTRERVGTVRRAAGSGLDNL